MADKFLEAAIPEPVRVFGLRLRPFSLGHLLLLDRLGSPYIRGGNIGINDLLLAVWICARGFRENTELLDSSEFWSKVKAWKRSVVIGRWLLALTLRKFEFAPRFVAFHNYMRSGQEIPKYFFESGKFSQSMGAPWMQTVRVRAIRDLGYSQDEVMDMPLSLLLWDYITLSELDGNVRIFDKQEHEEMTKAADEFHERMKKRGAV